jgi:tetratricopeptide (TPR) repeat protein
MSTIEEALSVAVGLQQSGHYRDAQRIYGQIVAIEPRNVDARHLLGVVEWQLGNLTAAIGHLQMAIALKPDFADAYYNLANAERDNGNSVEAMESYRRALALRGDFPAANTNLGHVLISQGRFAEAAECFRRVTELQPQSAKAYYHLARALREQGLVAEAADYCRQALARDSNLAEALNDLAVFHLDRGDFQEATELCRAAIQRQPGYAEAHYNLGTAQFEAGSEAEAAASYQRAIELKPEFAEAHHNLGNAWLALGEIERAEAAYVAALKLKPDWPACRWQQSLPLLMRGDFVRGWEEYEWRWKTGQLPLREFERPRWDGQRLRSETVLLYAEQGLGDTIQFIRYAPLVKERGATVVVECPRPLVKLLARCAGIDRLVAEGDELPPFGLQAPLLSLPGIFGTSLETIPASTPYLFADAALVDEWREKLSDLCGLRIGINWQGRQGHGTFRRRDIPLECWPTLAQIPGVQLVSLQQGPTREEFAALANRVPLVHFDEQRAETHGPFMDTAALMMNLDLVITSDTSVPHLAGGLGVPVWLALPFASDWRWLLDRSDSPWYPTMRVFRQKKPGDWAGVFAEIRWALQSAKSLYIF